jgi:hypothetical protein
MTPAYKGHKPHDLETLALNVDSARAVIGHPQILRVIVTNYYSAPLDEALTAIAHESGIEMRAQIKGRLDGINRGGNATTDNQECKWEFGTPHQVQLSLAV